MVNEQRARLEGLNPNQKIFCVNLGDLRYQLFNPVPKTRALGTAFGVPVLRYQRGLSTGALSNFSSSVRIFVLNSRKSFTRDYKQRGAAECSP